MVFENIEGHTEFNIQPDWYKNRKPGVSAVIRCYGEERWIGPCIESCLSLFDEILVTITDVKGDRTKDIVKGFESKKIKLLEYPFRLQPQNRGLMSCDSVHQFSYYTNWGLSKTTYSHVAARWDADHILRPEFATKQFHEYILSKTNVRVRAFNVVSDDFRFLSKTHPYQSFHVRFAKVQPYLYFTGDSDFATYYGIPQWFKPWYWKRFPRQQIMSIKNRMLFRDGKIDEPIFFHTKFLKMKEDELEKEGKFCVGAGKYSKATLESGININVNVPACAFKKPKEYLKN